MRTEFKLIIINKKKQIFCFFLLCSISTFSQIKVSGQIKDINDKAINRVNIVLKNSNSKDIIAYTYSNDEGIFEFNISFSGTYIYRLSCLGYKTIESQIVINNDYSFNKIILQDDVILLNEIIIDNDKNGIIEIGDTLRYKIEKFLNGTEETLKDVIKKMPGLDIDQNGKIKVNGKNVNKFLINGKEFFNNQEKLATENITSKMIKNLEIIKNYKEFKNINKEKINDIIAINVNIKENYKNKLIEILDVGLGNRYVIHSSLFNFSNKILFSFINDNNNTGDQSITIEDYLNYTNKTDYDIVGEVNYSNKDDLP